MAGDLKTLIGMSISSYLRQTFQVPKTWGNPDLYKLYVITAYVRENPAPKIALGKIRGITTLP